MKLRHLVGLALLGSSSQPAERDAGALRVGIEAKYWPFESVNAQGSSRGSTWTSSGSSARRSAARSSSTTWLGLAHPDLQAGRIDLICSRMSYTDERAKTVDFSTPYAQSPMSVLVASPGEGRDEAGAAQRDEHPHRGAARTTGETKARPRSQGHVHGSTTPRPTPPRGRLGPSPRVRVRLHLVDKFAKQYPDTTRVLDESLGSEEYCMSWPRVPRCAPRWIRTSPRRTKPAGDIDVLMKKWLPSPESCAPRRSDDGARAAGARSGRARVLAAIVVAVSLVPAEIRWDAAWNGGRVSWTASR